MRFAYLCCDFGVRPFGASGSSVHVREIARALRRRAHEVKIFSPSPGAHGEQDGCEDFHCLPLDGFAGEVASLLKAEDAAQPSHLAREWRRLLYAEYVQRALLPLFASFRPDAIYERYSLFSYAGLELAGHFRVPLLLEVNAPLTREAATYRELVLKHTAEELERRILRGADALFVVSEALSEFARELGVLPERITVLPTGVDPDIFDPSLSGDAVRSRYNLHGKRIIGFVGSLKRWHDLDTLVAAVRLLADADDRVHLLIVGQGPRLEQLRALGASYMTCTGAVEHDEVPTHMAAMDVVVIPYDRGGDSYFSPLKLFEAMAMAKPIVAARIGQVADMLADGETGVLCDPGDAEELARKLQGVLDMPDRGAGLGAAARRAAVTAHTWEMRAHQIEEVAQSLVETATVPR